MFKKGAKRLRSLVNKEAEGGQPDSGKKRNKAEEGAALARRLFFRKDLDHRTLNKKTDAHRLGLGGRRLRALGQGQVLSFVLFGFNKLYEGKSQETAHAGGCGGNKGTGPFWGEADSGLEWRLQLVSSRRRGRLCLESPAMGPSSGTSAGFHPAPGWLPLGVGFLCLVSDTHSIPPSTLGPTS